MPTPKKSDFPPKVAPDVQEEPPVVPAEELESADEGLRSADASSVAPGGTGPVGAGDGGDGAPEPVVLTKNNPIHQEYGPLDAYDVGGKVTELCRLLRVRERNEFDPDLADAVFRAKIHYGFDDLSSTVTPELWAALLPRLIPTSIGQYVGVAQRALGLDDNNRFDIEMAQRVLSWRRDHGLPLTTTIGREVWLSFFGE